MNKVSKHRHELRSVLITGATGGIGMELAKRYAKPGRMLILWGRNKERLDTIASLCCSRGAEVSPRQIDLSDGEAALAALREDEARHGLDLVILGAGLSDIKSPDQQTEDPAGVLKLALVNYATPVTLATAAAQSMIRQGYGKIVLIGSVAGFYELPFAASYSSSKAGLACFAQAANLAWRPKNVQLTLVIPGFVDTPMSQRLEGPRPFLVSAGSAARKIMQAIRVGQAELIFPWQFRVLRVAERLLPAFLRRHILQSLDVGQKEHARS
ncbi:SDR family NAD(P)-dependent oxidoreductase [Acetobacter orleanensis]|uniref:Oxidoreductase n=1 Tax=Acetobacter orleanensis TaxID=104099 RepID=A0A4Y3TIH4_9PROT|nr:SDR family NAD(P)-dependent oxidoreductase [Acetobacter orleanensis]GAN69024.1 oxidoreductase/short-chain dehydrogenase/reductase SDR [Acetobacter orleanensis JCM 7639]GBR30386.1 oxidoreductase [Acetobacter orleanensis NRIC 0473]GEB81568.1 oxidoreductase [Acetobacter orleanensis]